MANSSIFAAFERMWQHVVAALGNKSDVSHNHDNTYYTETEVDTMFVNVQEELDKKVDISTLENYYTETEVDNLLSGKSDSTHNHNNAYDTKGAASEALTSANSYTDTKTANLASNSAVDTKISTHNTNTEAHNDIRALIDGLTTRLNTLANSTDEDLDQMAELVDYIKSNKELIDAITTSKVNVADIVNNLTTNVSNQPLSAAQGVALKGLIDALEAEFDAHGHEIADVSGLQNALNNKANASDLTSHTNNKSNPHDVTLSQLGVTATADELNKMDGVTATTAELNYVDGVTSNIQTQLDGKQATISGAATTITGSNLTASRALVSNSSGKVAVSAVTSTELGYLDGVTSAIQTQLNNKAASSHNHAASNITSGTLSSDRLPTVPTTKGGTGATTVADARTNLDVYSKDEVDSALSSKASSSHTHTGYVPTTRTVNSKALSANITLSASDVGADASGTASSAVSTHNSSSSAHSSLFAAKANASDLTSHIDDTTVHMTSTEKTKLSGIETGAQVNTVKYEDSTLKANVGGTWTEIELGSSSGGGVGAAGTGTNAEIFNDYTNNVASGQYAHAAGYKCTASGNYSTAIGKSCVASGPYSFAGGSSSKAYSQYAFAYGENCIGRDGGWNAVALGCYSYANKLQCVVGRYNTEHDGPTSWTDTTGSLFIVGNGQVGTASGNAFRVSTAGKPYALSTLAGSGADYAEYFEWFDGNLNSEDRRGRFVTLDGEKIRFATAADDYILGIISAEPTIVGDIQSEMWHDMYLKDIYGERLTEVIEVPETIDEHGNIIPAHIDTRWIMNPDYDPEKEYISREDRPEWDAVGIVGKLVVCDDGTCQVNSYCYPSTDGIATSSETKTPYRVIERLDDSHIRVFIK